MSYFFTLLGCAIFLYCGEYIFYHVLKHVESYDVISCLLSLLLWSVVSFSLKRSKRMLMMLLLSFSYELFQGKHVIEFVEPSSSPNTDVDLCADCELLMLPLSLRPYEMLHSQIHEVWALQEIITTATYKKAICDGLIKPLLLMILLMLQLLPHLGLLLLCSGLSLDRVQIWWRRTFYVICASLFLVFMFDICDFWLYFFLLFGIFLDLFHTMFFIPLFWFVIAFGLFLRQSR